MEVAQKISAGDRLRLQVLECSCREACMKLPLSRVAESLSATGEFDHQAIAQAYSIDSRTIQPGELFFAVKGERMDGHDFVQQALEKGAVAAVVRKDQLSRYPAKAGLMAVDDTLVALQTLGSAVRRLVGEAAGGRHWIHGQDHDQRSDCACSLIALSGTEVRRQLQQSFWIAIDAAED